MQQLLDAFSPGKTIYLPGATGEIMALAKALAAEPARMRGVNVLSCALPGINMFDYAALVKDAAMTVFLPSPSLQLSLKSGKVRVLPMAYSGIARYLRDHAEIDVAVAHVAPPGSDGRCSFGIAADFSPIAWVRARRRVAVINVAMPSMRRGPSIDLGDADDIVECESSLLEVGVRAPSSASQAMARNIAALIPDGAAIQIGIGSAPLAVCDVLSDHRGLRLRSGIAPAGIQALAEAGTLATPDQHRVGIAGGSRDFYDWLGAGDLLAFADTSVTHDGATLDALDGFHAINGAIEVDLMGQVNLEWQAGALVSGVGGAPDFVRAAMRSSGGRAIIALPATARGGAASRIVPRLTTPTVSLAATDADTIATECGVAVLRGRTFDERAEALIAIAAEPFREELQRAWRMMRTGL